MRKLFVGMLMACLLTAFAFAADNTAPPKYIWTQHVTLAGDKTANYPNLVAQFRHAVETTKANVYWIAAGNLTGSVRQLNFISFYDNFAAIETDMPAYKAIDEELMQKNPEFSAQAGAAELEPHSIIAKYIPSLSFNADKVAIPDAKWWEITTVYIKPGRESAFADLVKQEQDLLQKGGADEHFLTYRIIAGAAAPGAAYYIVIPRKSLAEMDVDNSSKMKDVVTPLIRQHMDSMAGDILTRIETNILMVRPDMSRPPQTFLAANPDFWTIKEPAQPVVAAKKKQPKKAAPAVGE